MPRYVDLHNHFLFDVDDGPLLIEDSITMLQQAVKNGITDAVATPHQYEDDQLGDFQERQDMILRHFNELKKRVEEEALPIELHLGSELYFTSEIVNAGDVPYYTINDNKKYALIEFSLNWHPEGYKEVFYELIQNGITPILAHPERYAYFWEMAEDIIDLVKMGAFLQINAGSLLGYQGVQARFVSEMLLKEGLAHIICSDAHRPRRVMGFNMIRAVETYKVKYPDQDIDKLISDYPLKVVQGEVFEIDDEPCYRFNLDKQYKKWRRYYFFHNMLGIGKRKKRIKRKKRY